MNACCAVLFCTLQAVFCGFRPDARNAVCYLSKGEEEMGGKVILTARGLNTEVGCKLILPELKKMFPDLQNRSILLIFPPDYELTEKLSGVCESVGIRESNILVNDPLERKPDIIYVTEGNTFEVLDFMRRQGLCSKITEWVRGGAVYVGSSAGAVIATEDIKIAGDFDSNFVRMWDYTGLCLVRGTVLPHYTVEQYERYRQEADPELLSRYTEIVPVSNEEIRICEAWQGN